MQLQSDLLGVDVERSASSETIAWGAALAAGLASGVDTWNLDSLQVPPPLFIITKLYPVPVMNPRYFGC